MSEAASRKRVYGRAFVPRLPLSEEVQRFWRFVDKTDACWLWMGSCSSAGYGKFADKNRRHVGAHRFSYELHSGSPIPKGMVIDHLCRTPACVRPDHMEVVVQRVNFLRGESPAAIAYKARVVSGRCKNGHYLGPNLERWRQSYCMDCHNAWARDYQRKHKRVRR